MIHKTPKFNVGQRVVYTDINTDRLFIEHPEPGWVGTIVLVYSADLVYYVKWDKSKRTFGCTEAELMRYVENDPRIQQLQIQYRANS